MHEQSGTLITGGIALGMIGNAINPCSDVPANKAEANHGSQLVKFPCTKKVRSLLRSHLIILVEK